MECNQPHTSGRAWPHVSECHNIRSGYDSAFGSIVTSAKNKRTCLPTFGIGCDGCSPKLPTNDQHQGLLLDVSVSFPMAFLPAWRISQFSQAVRLLLRIQGFLFPTIPTAEVIPSRKTWGKSSAINGRVQTRPTSVAVGEFVMVATPGCFSPLGPPAR